MALNSPSNLMQEELEVEANRRVSILIKNEKSSSGKDITCSFHISYSSSTDATITFTTNETGTSCRALYEINNAGKWYCKKDWND